jgi:diadenylate cyclase
MQQLQDLITYLEAMSVVDVIDIALVTGLISALLYAVRGTRAVQLLRGILLLVLVVFLFSQVLRLRAFGWLVSILLPALLITIPVVFQPELRRALERLGRAGVPLSRSGGSASPSAVVTVVALAARQLSELGYGGLIVLERATGLDDLAERGVRLDAEAGVDLLVQIFYPNTPLHDGAVIIRDGRVLAAGVVLPLGEPRDESRGMGTRHLAALAVSEISDALAVVVSEETGTISLARDGQLHRSLDEGALSRLLYQYFVGPPSTPGRLLTPWLHIAHPEHDRGGVREQPAQPGSDAAGEEGVPRADGREAMREPRAGSLAAPSSSDSR